MFLPLLTPARYKGARGGRGSGKSHFFAERLVEEAASGHIRAACLREVQSSIKDSVKQLIEDKIRAHGLTDLFRIAEQEIRGPNDSLIIFRGLQGHTARSIKSLEGFNRAFVEEAQAVSQSSLDILTPTFRADAELWFSWNPTDPADPVDRFFLSNEADPDFRLVRANYPDNPWFPAGLKRDMARDRRSDLDKYAHVWLGGYQAVSDAQVLRGRCVVEGLAPGAGWDGPYFGADWGYSVDPTALVKLWVNGRTLYLEAEAYGAGVEIDNLPALFRTIAGAETHVIRADAARPETISYLRRHGFPRLLAAEKWPGSVQDGVEHLRSYDRIVIHPACVNAIREARLWRWRQDRLTGDVMPELLPGDDHVWDAARYALSPLIRRRAPARQVRLPLLGR